MTKICRLLLTLPVAFAAVGLASSASAQYAPNYKPNFGVSKPSTGERYHVEVAGEFWNPSLDMVVSSSALNLIGSQINAVTDLGFAKTRFSELRVVLRLAKKHKLRLGYIPIKYNADSVLSRTINFSGTAYSVGLPVATAFNWSAWRFGYEYDFVYRDKGFVGAVIEAKYTDVQISLQSAIAAGAAHAQAPVPAIGGIGRVYVAPNVSITGELTGFKLPANLAKDYRAHYIDFDIYGTWNMNDHVGAQAGYRSFDMLFVESENVGTFKLKGPYFGGVVRF